MMMLDDVVSLPGALVVGFCCSATVTGCAVRCPVPMNCGERPQWTSFACAECAGTCFFGSELALWPSLKIRWVYAIDVRLDRCRMLYSICLDESPYNPICESIGICDHWLDLQTPGRDYLSYCCCGWICSTLQLGVGLKELLIMEYYHQMAVDAVSIGIPLGVGVT
ncbi:hypothetical protein AKJ16_DCAP02663 [Drosera capensis]